MTTTVSDVSPVNLRRLRWAVRATLALGVAVSVTANVLHAREDPIAQAIAAWPPLALLITVDLVSRVPVHRRALGAVRIGATFAIAAIAAFVSYGHMAGVAARFGESGLVPYLLPLSVDGLVIVASVSLVELAGRLRATIATTAIETTPVTASVRSSTTQPVHAPAPNWTAAWPDSPSPVTQREATSPRSDRYGELDQHAEPDDADQRDRGNIGEPDAAGPGDDPSDNAGPPRPVAPAEPDELPRRVYLAPTGLAGDLVPLLGAARQARNDLLAEGRAVTRDALAARLRADGHAIRTTRIAELLAALKIGTTPSDGRHPSGPDGR